MTLPTFTAALATPSKAPLPALVDGPLPEAPGLTADGAIGGFAAALDEAAASLEALTAGVLDGATPALPGVPELPLPTPPVAAAAVGAAIPTLLPTAAATHDAMASATSSGTPLAAPATSAPGWPPPGLSSLFPTTPVLAAQAGAPTAPASAGFGSDGLSPQAVGNAYSTDVGLASTSLGARAIGGAAPIETMTIAAARGTVAALMPDASIASASDGGNASATARMSTSSQASATPVLLATPLPAANAPAPEALAAALARQPASLRLPVADEGGAGALTVITEGLGTERGPDLAPTGLTAPTPTPMPHKLDLAQAFPAPVPLPSPRFAEEVGARLQWIAEQQGGEATLRISPDGLGPVEIRMKLDGDRVDLGFAATQQDTRQALQDALPKLREMLAQQGLQLGQADVGQKHAQSSNDEASKTARGFAGDDEGEGIVLAPQPREATLVIGRGGRGVLDLYA